MARQELQCRLEELDKSVSGALLAATQAYWQVVSFIDFLDKLCRCQWLANSSPSI